MSPDLRNQTWRISYSSTENNPIADFYIPALECAVQYDRKSGFFNSAILSKVARGLGAMLYNQGKIRLIMGCQFSPQDLDAIQQGYALRDALTFRLETELTHPETFVQLQHFEILSWLIAHQYLEIKIAIPLKSNGLPEDPQTQLDYHHIFHEKVGIFTDKQGDIIAFSGSNNESLSGWESNIESFHIYCSWEGGRELERVQEEQFRFEQLWYQLSPNVRVFDIPEAVEKKILQYTPTTQPAWNKQTEFDTRNLQQHSKIKVAENSQSVNETENPQKIELEDIKELENQTATFSKEDWQQETFAFETLLNLHQHPGCLDYCLKSIPISPWPHQIKILRRVAQTFPKSFLIADEVGLGKTIETGLILRYLLISQKAKRILILAPASIQPQWHEELREKFNLHFWSYSKGELIPPKNAPLTPSNQPSTNIWNSENLILASSHLVRRSERMQELLEAEPWDLIVLDEAHHARRKSPQNRKETPNSLLQLMQKLRHRTKSLMLLSATPMQIDTIEIFDLLNLLGLKGHWQYGDNFCDYFSTLSEKPNKFILDFWQQMAVDYFKQGGSPCPQFQHYLETQDRLLACELEYVWQDGIKLINPKHYLENPNFINTSKHYLTVNTPLKDLMFRHTRDTLRQYYRRGILDQDIAQRLVQDNAITLEKNREIPLYRAVSDYVRHFYNLAQKENQKALGFIMTLYRKRLTSSFYAIRESLQRRLDGINITPDDLGDLDDADDPIIEGLEGYVIPADPQEIAYLQDLLLQFENTGEDSKLSHCISILRQELSQRESAIIFTQYTDTMDYLRQTLQQLYGSQIACYSGRGGELYQNSNWKIVPKEQIKNQFRAGEIKVLLCTESASEGLNLQTCGVLINYDMPWNPMRVEQRIGRLDRIGQRYSTVRIHNFYYDGTVEAKVYRKLRDRIDAFQTVVGNLQPILAQVPTFIEKAAMSADPEEEGVLLADFEQVLETPPLRPSLDEMVAMDVEADLLEIRQPLPSTPLTAESLEELLTRSQILNRLGFYFEKREPKIWQLTFKNQTYSVTFYPEIFDEHPSLQFMNFGNPLFNQILESGLELKRLNYQ
ncbi:MAG TPA: helicase-related protein [Candidatus Obscuribacterales bacterium]